MKKHIIDDLDIFIFISIYNSNTGEEPINNWQIAQRYAEKIYTGTRKYINDHYSKYYRLIKARMEIYCQMGIFHKCTEDGNVIYEMDLDKINFTDFDFPEGRSSAIVFKINQETQSL